MPSRRYGRLNKWCLLILAKPTSCRCPEKSLSQVGRTQPCSIHICLPKLHRKQSPVYRDLSSLSPSCPTQLKLMVHLIFLLLYHGPYLTWLTQTMNSHIVHVSPSVAKLTSFPAKLTSFPFLIELLNWMGSENTADTVYLDSAKGMIRSRGLSVARMAKKSNRQGR